MSLPSDRLRFSRVDSGDSATQCSLHAYVDNYFVGHVWLAEGGRWCVVGHNNTIKTDCVTEDEAKELLRMFVDHSARSAPPKRKAN
jgi:hypothetical protein